MGLFKLLRYAYANRLVKRDVISTPPGVETPIAVDLWNVMYTLVERMSRDAAARMSAAEATTRSLFKLLRTLERRAYFPIFVSDRGIGGYGRITRGAKAIVNQTMAHLGGSGRVAPFLPEQGTDDEVLKTYEYPARDADATAPLCEASPLAAGAASPRAGPRLAHKLCVDLIRHLGYAYVDILNMEADDICANLFHTNTVAQIYTTDTDMILTGCDLILDVAPLFPPILRCRDVLASLGLPYSRFLASFVRCHTDLHAPPVLRSVQQVIRSLRLGRTPSSESEEEEDGEEADAPPVSHPWDPAPSDGAASPETGPWPRARDADDPRLTTTRATVERYSVRTKYASRYPPILQTCGDAVWFLPPTRTRGDVVEKKFVRHVISMISPLRQDGVSLLKRVPIYQDRLNPRGVHEALKQCMGGEDSERFAGSFWKPLTPPRSYHAVLTEYWDDARAYTEDGR
ncbi:tegument host shutoff protein [Beluga whale alphaherpesvirus 1]|uniref:Virion host shutoff protein n=1 Tax=Beluga whale alphaherpesvirus 1 TaxID=1434720 RepID=A0A286RUI6_9ALPH|nr:tegument host shutoff protein [Beluga whale alphaherpesvirus 1]ASW27065.1 tegument host shutoff protein [Beluga whale alphaherpesvirus 1]